VPDLKALLTDGSAAWGNEQRAEVVCWGLVQFLSESEARRPVLKNFIKNLQGSPREVSNSVAVMNKVYPGGVTKLENDFRRWIGEL
jgi:hypothetical protein